MLVCSASEVLNRTSWEKLLDDCGQDDPLGERFVSICNLFYSSVTSYCASRMNRAEPSVGSSLVDLIHVLFTSSRVEIYQRTALKLLPRCHDTEPQMVQSGHAHSLDNRCF